MKSLFIQLLVLPRGLAILGVFCGVNLMLCNIPTQYLADQGGDEFPGNRQGGGTHMSLQPEVIQ